MGDIEPTKMPDGTIISGRAALRQYYKDHGVTNVSDYNTPGGYWDKKAAERARMFQGGQGFDSARRVEHLRRAWEKLSRR